MLISPHPDDDHLSHGTLALLNTNGNKINTGAGSSYGAAYADGNTIGVAFDADNGTLIFYKNGVSQGTAFTGLTGTFAFACTAYATNKWIANFGQRAFAHAAPSGFKCLTVENLPDPTGPAAEPNKYFDAKLWTGNGSSQGITGYSFSPDLAWIKGRSNARDNALFDTVRGVEKYLVANSTAAESTSSSTLTAFNSDGFTLGGQSRTNANNEAAKTLIFLRFCL